MKYMGSKNRFAKDLVPVIQSYITEETKGYLEPFVGGANMIDKINCSKKFGCDLNEYVIELLEFARDYPYKLPTEISNEEYISVMKNIDKYDKWYVGFVRFYALLVQNFLEDTPEEKIKMESQETSQENLLIIYKDNLLT